MMEKMLVCPQIDIFALFQPALLRIVNVCLVEPLGFRVSVEALPVCCSCNIAQKFMPPPSWPPWPPRPVTKGSCLWRDLFCVGSKKSNLDGVVYAKFKPDIDPIMLVGVQKGDLSLCVSPSSSNSSSISLRPRLMPSLSCSLSPGLYKWEFLLSAIYWEVLYSCVYECQRS